MSFARCGLLWVLFPGLLLAADRTLSLNLSSAEKAEIQARLQRFMEAKKDDPTPMFYRPLKYGLKAGTFIHPNSGQGLPPTGGSPRNPLLELAGKKLTPEFRKLECETILKKHFPQMHCERELEGGWASVEDEDRYTNLTEGWVASDRLVSTLDDAPVSGFTLLSLWSDDYWKTEYGILSYRYAEGKEFKRWEDAVGSYKQPDEWISLFGALSLDELATKVARLSPAEKYDLAVGDEGFALTREQKGEGKYQMKDGKVESWIGICHGWVNASIMAPRPLHTVSTTGAKGVAVTFYPADVRSLLSLSWANGDQVDTYAGVRCATKDPKTFPNGRLQDQKCFDSNPATLHLALANLIGKAGLGFIMDKSFDYEVWNQPVAGYEFLYFNPLDSSQTSKNWKEVAVDYNDAFKAHDRFQKPLTRGVRGQKTWDDSRIKKIVGVIANVSYLQENEPKAEDSPDADNLARETYLYDLELELKDGVYVPTGGEWYQLAHPDFLWMPGKNTIASDEAEPGGLQYSIAAAPSDAVTSAAKEASQDGFPLCHVVRELLKASSGEEAYRCEPSDPEIPMPRAGSIPPGQTTPARPPEEDCHQLPQAPSEIVMTVSNLATQVSIDGESRGDFQASGATRRFDSPPLDPCQTFHYTLTISTWKLVDGQWNWSTEDVSVGVKAARTTYVTVNYDGSIVVDDSATH